MEVLLHVRDSEAAGDGAASRSVTGRLLRVEPSALVLAVSQADRSAGSIQFARPTTLERQFDMSAVVGVERRGISYLKTGALAAAVVTGAVLVARLLWDQAGGGLSSDGSGTGPL